MLSLIIAVIRSSAVDPYQQHPGMLSPYDVDTDAYEHDKEAGERRGAIRYYYLLSDIVFQSSRLAWHGTYLDTKREANLKPETLKPETLICSIFSDF